MNVRGCVLVLPSEDMLDPESRCTSFTDVSTDREDEQRPLLHTRKIFFKRFLKFQISSFDISLHIFEVLKKLLKNRLLGVLGPWTLKQSVLHAEMLESRAVSVQNFMSKSNTTRNIDEVD